MALIKCEECGQMVSDKADSCPNCGCPVVKKPVASIAEENGSNVKENKKNKPRQLKYIVSASILVVLVIIGYFICTHLFNKVDDNFQEQLPEPENTNIINGHEYVDLGLSVMWAICNVGADTPEDYGDYFAWGEIKPKSTYTEENCTTSWEYLGDIAGNPDYDAARANWGGTWRMPTKDEIIELNKKCTTEWTTRNGTKGRLVTSKINGNSIFLPAAGSRGESLGGTNVMGNYWASSSEGKESAYYLQFYQNGYFGGFWSHSHHVGQSVRPVSDGTTTPKGTKIISNSELSTPSGTINGHEYVDLGLSVKWATCNVGASRPGDYGDYFAWGEIKPKPIYTEDNCTTYNKRMGDIAGNPDYDAARANWGGTWRMPTNKEIDELLVKCNHTWTTQGGHSGIEITGPNGNSIFLPFAGYRDGSDFEGAEEEDYGYWSSSPVEGSTQKAYGFYEVIEDDYGWGRYCGLSVRPVSE